jgi:hypothetical protein
MSQRLAVELSDELARSAQNVAAASNQRLEDAVVHWISQAIAEPEIEAFSDAELLTRCDTTMAADLQEELSGLLSDAREGELGDA